MSNHRFFSNYVGLNQVAIEQPSVITVIGERPSTTAVELFYSEPRACSRSPAGIVLRRCSPRTPPRYCPITCSPWGVFVWRFAVLFLSCVRVCVGSVVLCRCVCVCVWPVDLFTRSPAGIVLRRCSLLRPCCFKAWRLRVNQGYTHTHTSLSIYLSIDLYLPIYMSISMCTGLTQIPPVLPNHVLPHRYSVSQVQPSPAVLLQGMEVKG